MYRRACKSLLFGFVGFVKNELTRMGVDSGIRARSFRGIERRVVVGIKLVSLWMHTWWR